jgi:transposase InsO family protein
LSHANARLTVHGRLLLVTRIEQQGRPVAHVADELGVSRATGYKWWDRWRKFGLPGLLDRPSRPHSCPRRTPAAVETAICELRRTRKLGPRRIAAILGVAASTVYAVLRRHGLHRLTILDRPTPVPIRRYERSRSGDLVHIDVKKLGRIPDGGGWRAGSREQFPNRRRRQTGYEFVHSAVDDHSRLAYSEIHSDEKADTCADFLDRALAFFATHGAPVREVITDNAFAYRHGRRWRERLAADGIKHRFIRPYRPQTNGKVERFNRTLLEEWAYAAVFTSSRERADVLPGWLHTYNHHRSHTALDGQPPISRVNDLPGHYS